MKKNLHCLLILCSMLVASWHICEAQTWLQQFPSGTPAVARYSVGQAYDVANDRLILFSGEDHQGLPRPTDVWVLMNATGTAPGWLQLFPTGGPPFGRFGTTEVYAPSSNRLIIHAGCGGNCTPMLNDTWVLTNANGMGGAAAWISLPAGPIARGEHAAAYDDATNRMIIFGGHTGFPGTERNDVWVLTHADGMGGTPTWVQLFPAGTPPVARRPYSMAYDPATNRLIVFGGLNTVPCCSTLNLFNDVWVLTNANGLGGTPQWIPLAPLGTAPSARAANTVVYDSSSNRLVVFAGSPGSFPPPPANDVWVLTNANGLGGTPQWVQLSPAGSPPPGRSSHTAGFNPITGRMVIAMGRNDALPSPSVLNDVWVLTNANGIQTVNIDVKPESCPNPLKVKQKGALSVAIVGDAGFDPSLVDPSTIRLEGISPVHWDLEDVTEPFPGAKSGCEDCTALGADGFADLVLKFDARDIVDSLGSIDDRECRALQLTGELMDGTPIQGEDLVVILKK